MQQYRDNGRSLVKETIMRRLLALFAVGLALVASPAVADWTGKNAAGTTTLVVKSTRPVQRQEPMDNELDSF